MRKPLWAILPRGPTNLGLPYSNDAVSGYFHDDSLM